MTNNGHAEGALLFILFAIGSSEKLDSPPAAEIHAPAARGHEVMMLGQESRAPAPASIHPSAPTAPGTAQGAKLL